MTSEIKEMQRARLQFKNENKNLKMEADFLAAFKVNVACFEQLLVESCPNVAGSLQTHGSVGTVAVGGVGGCGWGVARYKDNLI